MEDFRRVKIFNTLITFTNYCLNINILLNFFFFFIRLNAIHKKNFIHRDLHSDNILLSSYQTWLIGDLGLSQPENSASNEIYGVIPYVAPEIFKGAVFSKESD